MHPTKGRYEIIHLLGPLVMADISRCLGFMSKEALQEVKLGCLSGNEDFDLVVTRLYLIMYSEQIDKILALKGREHQKVPTNV